MLKWYWVIAALVGLLWYRNTRYAIKQYLANRNYVLFTFYMVLLIGLGYLLVNITAHVMTLVQASQEVLNTP
jgi:hypothetical protein